MIDNVDSNHSNTQKVWSEVYTGRVVSFLDPSMKNNTASILKSTRVGTCTIPFKLNHSCACPINYPSAYSGKHINSPHMTVTILNLGNAQMGALNGQISG